MQFTFFKNLCSNLLDNDYKLVVGSYESEAITENSKHIAFAKNAGAVFYFIFVVRLSKTENYKEIIHNMSSRCQSAANPFNSRSIVFLSVLITDEINEELNCYSEINDIIGNEEFIELRWIVNPNLNQIIVNGNQPKKINGIEKIINSSFQCAENNSASTLTNELNSAAERQKSRLKSKNIFLTLSLIILLILIHIYQIINNNKTGGSYFSDSFCLYSPYILNNNEYYRLFTSFFIHSDFLHLASNCLGLYIMGSRVEKYFGKIFFILIYLLTGLFSSIATVLFLPEAASLGASGAIFGLEGAVFSYILLKNKSLDGFDINFILIYSAIGIGMGFMQPGVNNAAHVSGFISGIILTALYLNLFSKHKKI